MGYFSRWIPCCYLKSEICITIRPVFIIMDIGVNQVCVDQIYLCNSNWTCLMDKTSRTSRIENHFWPQDFFSSFNRFNPRLIEQLAGAMRKTIHMNKVESTSLANGFPIYLSLSGVVDDFAFLMSLVWWPRSVASHKQVSRADNSGVGWDTSNIQENTDLYNIFS